MREAKLITVIASSRNPRVTSCQEHAGNLISRTFRVKPTTCCCLRKRVIKQRLKCTNLCARSYVQRVIHGLNRAIANRGCVWVEMLPFMAIDLRSSPPAFLFRHTSRTIVTRLAVKTID